MARPLRLEYEGAFYHVTSRGNERRKIFFSATDYRKFTDYLGEAKKKYSIVVHCYVLMPNHYHLLIETPEANLGRVMHYLNGAYTTYINIRKNRSGHLFQGRYKAIVVDRDIYLGELSRYIHLNPVRAKMIEKPEDYAYSSYGSYITGKGGDLVTTDVILGLAGGGKRYREFVEAGVGLEMESPASKVYGGMIIGSAAFIREMLKKLKEEYEGKAEISHRRVLKTACIGDEILSLIARELQLKADDIRVGRQTEAKKAAIYLLKKHTGMTNGEIGRQIGGLSYSAVAKVCGRMEGEMEKNKQLRVLIEKIEKEIANVKG